MALVRPPLMLTLMRGRTNGQFLRGPPSLHTDTASLWIAVNICEMPVCFSLTQSKPDP